MEKLPLLEAALQNVAGLTTRRSGAFIGQNPEEVSRTNSHTLAGLVVSGER